MASLLWVEIGSGDIRLIVGNGAVHAKTRSGDVERYGNPATDWNLETGSASIHLHLPSETHYILSANTSSTSVDVASPVTVQGSLNQQHGIGTVRADEPTIRVSAGSGDISVTSTRSATLN